MIRSVLLALIIAACLYAFSWLGEAPGGPFVRACVGVALGITVATVAYGEATWTTVGVGALSPLSLAALEAQSFALAASVMCFLWLVPRLALAETRRTLATLVTASLVAAAVAGWVFASYIGGPLPAQLASCVFAGSCLSLVTILVPVDTSVGCALRTAAAVIQSPARAALERAAAAHREAVRLPSAPRRAEWGKLARMADERAGLARAQGVDAIEARKDLDERIEALAEELAPMPSRETPPSAEPEIPVADGTLAEESAGAEVAPTMPPTTSPPDPR